MKQQSVNCRTFIKWSGLPAILALALPVCANDAARLAALLTPAIEQGGLVSIPPGDYELDGAKPLLLASHMTVSAYGARFHLPKTLGDKARAVMFAGENVSDFRWLGGHFTGNVFDPAKADNTWEPNANTRAILITTSPGGRTEDLTFRDVTSDGLAGAAITVLGAEKKGSEREVETLAKNISAENCRLERSGKCMWDYGLLWQITVWPEDYSPREREMAAKYFRNDLIRGPVRMETGDDHVLFDTAQSLPVTKSDNGGRGAVCFFGDVLPTNIVRGKQYFVIKSTPQFIRIAEKPGGAAIRFAGSAGPQARLISDLFLAHLALFAPTGSGPGKGALDLVACSNVVVRGCTLSALGDTMHIQKSCDILFANNRITGSRMGAFFLAEYCKNAVIVSNTVNGSNGSRVMSIEKSAENVTIMANTFCNGGRGSWINQPRKLLMQGNIFSNNTTKCEHDPQRGRRSFVTGDYERYAEMYFTTYETGGRYGEVILRGNTFTTGPEASHAITFAPGGDTLLVERNTFMGHARSIPAATGCTNVTLRDNVGIEPPLAVRDQLASAAESAPAFRLDAKSQWMIEYGGATKPEVLRFAAEQLDATLSRMLGEPARSSLAERNWEEGGYHIRLVA